MMKRLIILILCITATQSFYSQGKTPNYEENGEIMKKINAETEALNLQKNVFGGTDSTISFGGYNYHNINGRDYSEVAEANNWSKWSLPDDMDEQYAQYYQQKKIKNIVLTFCGFLVLFLIIFFLYKKSNKIKREKTKVLLGGDFEIYEKKEKEHHQKIASLNSLLSSKILTESEYMKKKKNIELDFSKEKDDLRNNQKDIKMMLRKKEMIAKIEEAYENKILTKEEYASKMSKIN